MTTHPVITSYRTHASFGKRLAAYLVDMLVIGPTSFVIGYLLGIFLYNAGIRDDATLSLCGNVFGLLYGWLYFAGMESSSHQGTLGKMWVGIKVTDLAGNPISFGRATGRYFAKLISGLLFGIGYLLIAFTENRQGLHDLIAGCLGHSKKIIIRLLNN